MSTARGIYMDLMECFYSVTVNEMPGGFPVCVFVDFNASLIVDVFVDCSLSGLFDCLFYRAFVEAFVDCNAGLTVNVFVSAFSCV